MRDEYKVKEIEKMLGHETDESVHYGARLSHWYGDTNVLTIDAGGLRVLKEYYSAHDTNLDGPDEPATLNEECNEDGQHWAANFVVTCKLCVSAKDEKEALGLFQKQKGELMAAIQAKAPNALTWGPINIQSC